MFANEATRESVELNLHPSPPWGRGWTATGAFISRGGTGEGVKTEVQGQRMVSGSVKAKG